MSTVTYDTAPIAAVTAPEAGAAKAGFWRRVFDRMAEARMRQAEDFIARHRYLVTAMEQGRTWR